MGEAAGQSITLLKEQHSGKDGHLQALTSTGPGIALAR